MYTKRAAFLYVSYHTQIHIILSNVPMQIACSTAVLVASKPDNAQGHGHRVLYVTTKGGTEIARNLARLCRAHQIADEERY